MEAGSPDKNGQFNLYYYPVNSVRNNILRRLSESQGAKTLQSLGLRFNFDAKYRVPYTKIVIRYTSKRCQAILRNLRPNTEYDVLLCASNFLGEGEAEKASFKTGDGSLAIAGPRITVNRPRPLFRFRRDDVTHYLIALVVSCLFISCVIYMLGVTYENQICERLAIASHVDILREVCPTEYDDMIRRLEETRRSRMDRNLLEGYTEDAADVRDLFDKFADMWR